MTTPRQRALAALAHRHGLNDIERETFLKLKASTSQTVLTRNLASYFEALLIDDRGMTPAFSMQELTDSLADSLVQMGQKNGLGVAVLQTLVHELQDRINHINSK